METIHDRGEKKKEKANVESCQCDPNMAPERRRLLARGCDFSRLSSFCFFLAIIFTNNSKIIFWFRLRSLSGNEYIGKRLWYPFLWKLYFSV